MLLYGRSTIDDLRLAAQVNAIWSTSSCARRRCSSLAPRSSPIANLVTTRHRVLASCLFTFDTRVSGSSSVDFVLLCRPQRNTAAHAIDVSSGRGNNDDDDDGV
jgi:hypothetical protein